MFCNLSQHGKTWPGYVIEDTESLHIQNDTKSGTWVSTQLTLKATMHDTSFGSAFVRSVASLAWELYVGHLIAQTRPQYCLGTWPTFMTSMVLPLVGVHLNNMFIWMRRLLSTVPHQHHWHTAWVNHTRVWNLIQQSSSQAAVPPIHQPLGVSVWSHLHLLSPAFSHHWTSYHLLLSLWCQHHQPHVRQKTDLSGVRRTCC